MLSAKKISSKFRSEYNVDYSSIEMVSNDKSMNYKVVYLNKWYKFCIKFISYEFIIQNSYDFFKNGLTPTAIWECYSTCHGVSVHYRRFRWHL
jgi:hypothetical protein